MGPDTVPSHAGPNASSQVTPRICASPAGYLDLGGLRSIVHPETARNAQEQEDFEAQYQQPSTSASHDETNGDRRMRSVSVDSEQGDDSMIFAESSGRTRGETISQRNYMMED